jgi:hypothetical protein
LYPVSANYFIFFGTDSCQYIQSYAFLAKVAPLLVSINVLSISKLAIFYELCGEDYPIMQVFTFFQLHFVISYFYVPFAFDILNLYIIKTINSQFMLFFDENRREPPKNKIIWRGYTKLEMP